MGEEPALGLEFPEPGSAAESAAESANERPADLPGRRWPSHLQTLATRLRTPLDEQARDEILGQAWRILNGALTISLRSHARGSARVTPEDLEDLAAEKSLVLLRRIVSGETDFVDRSPAEIVSFFSRVARHDLLDLLKQSSRRTVPLEEDRTGNDIDQTSPGQLRSSTEPPDAQAERREFAGALRRCAEQLESRARLVWFFRVFYDMPSRDIAVHPRIDLTASYVDVMLQRVRQAMRQCMHRRGFDAQDMPTGTFAELWRTFRPDAMRPAR